MRLGKFFRKHLGKYFLSRPPASDETEQRESIEGNDQSDKDSGPTTEHLEESIADSSYQLNKRFDGTVGSTLNDHLTDSDDPLLRIKSETPIKTSNSSADISSTSNQTQSQVETQSVEGASLIPVTISQSSDSSEQGKETSWSNQLNVKRQSNEGLGLSPATDTQPFESNKPYPDKPELYYQIPLQVEGFGSQSTKDFVFGSECSNQVDYLIDPATPPKFSPNTAVTGITESVQAPLSSTQSNLVNENNREPERAANAEIPTQITAPGLTVRSTPPPNSNLSPIKTPQIISNHSQFQPSQARKSPNTDQEQSKPENAADSVSQSSQLAKTLTHAGQLKDMVSRPQHVPYLTSHKLSELPSNSTSLRNYLESTSVRRSSSPRQDTLPGKNPAVTDRDSSISVSPRPASPRHLGPPEKSATAAVRGQSPALIPSNLKKSSDIIAPKDVPKDVKDGPNKVEEGNEETFEENPGTSTTPEEEASVVTLIEVSDSTKEVIESAMKRFRMKEMTTQGYWNVRWSDNGVSIQVCQKLQKYQRVNRFPGSGLLMTKNNLAKNTTKMKLNFAEDYDFVPETWCLSGEISKVEQHARAHNHDCFIVKPNDGSSGKGIIITRNIPKLKTCEKMVCQVYICKPYLIDGYKFDLRIYTLITSCRPLRLFVYNEGLARFATEQYEEPNQQNESNRYMHLTNYAVNKRSPSYTVDETKGTLRRLTTISKWMVRHNVDAKKVWESMDDAIVKTIISFLPALRHNYRVSFPGQTESNSCFQILGFDIIFDENLKPYVLEVNDSPSFKADVPLDKEMTEALIHDTFNILHLDENDRSKVLMEEKRQSRMRLLSSSTQNRNAIYKEKEQNERLLTQSRIDWENTHMGNYRKVFPNEQKMKHYKKFIRASQEIFFNHS